MSATEPLALWGRNHTGFPLQSTSRMPLATWRASGIIQTCPCAPSWPSFMLTSAAKPLVSAAMPSKAWPRWGRQPHSRAIATQGPATGGRCTSGSTCYWPVRSGFCSLPLEASRKSPCPCPAEWELQAKSMTVGGVLLSEPRSWEDTLLSLPQTLWRQIKSI